MQRAGWRQECLGAKGQQRKRQSGREDHRRDRYRVPCRLDQKREAHGAQDGWRRRRQGRCGRPQSAQGERGGR